MEMKEYHDNGQLYAIGEIVDGKKQGEWLYYYESGMLDSSTHYLDGVEHGKSVSWHENGNLAFEAEKRDGFCVGTIKEYYPNGALMEIGEYRNGEYSPVDFWDEEGNQILVNGTGKIIRSYGPNGYEVSEFYLEGGRFIKELKLSSVTYGRFYTKDELGL